jgi:DNA-binding IscR family transcriptional regulator
MENGCLSRSVWLRVQESISQVLDSTTLADLQAGSGTPAAGFGTPLEMFRDLSTKAGCGIKP